MPVAAVVAGAVATVGGAVLSANAQKKAAKKAAGAVEDSSAANIQLAKDTYAQNASRLDPFVSQGQTAGNAIMSILGFSGAPATGTQTTQPYGAPEPAVPEMDGGVFGNAIRNAVIQKIQNGETVDPAALNRWGLTDYAAKFGQWKAGQTTPTAGAPMTSASALDAFNTFKNSTDYQYRFDQGLKAEQMGMGALGAFDSGATRKAMIDYGGHMATAELGNWMDRLAQQQQFGMGAASALAGVSQNMASASMAANNNAASAIGNAALVGGAANQQMYGQIAGALGSFASSWPKG